MNAERFTAFIEAYVEGLRLAITQHRHRYHLAADDSPETFALRGALKVAELIERDGGPRSVYVEADGFRNACKALKIDHSEKSINQFLEVMV